MSKAALPFRVLVITNEPACARAGRGVVETMARALLPSAPGAAVLVRGGSAASRAELRALCAALLPIVRRAHALLLVHTFTDLVRELGLDGAHVSARLNFAEVTAARAALPAGALLGASRHDGDALDSQALAPLDYVTLSPVFSPSSKHDDRAPLGVAALARLSAKPIVALGGIDSRRAPACLRAGASAVAVIGAIMHAHEPRRALLALSGVGAVYSRKIEGSSLSPRRLSSS